QQAQARLKVVSAEIMRDTVPDWDSRGKKEFLAWQLSVLPAANGWTVLRRQFSNPLAVLMILVGIVLLIACANMANLLLARASSRQREIAVRMAMGAGRGRVVRQLLTESILLSALGGLAGLAFAVWSSCLLVALLASSQNIYMSGQEIQFDLTPDWRVMLFTLGAAVACGLLFGLAPALRAARVGVSASLKERAHSVRAAGGRLGMWRILLSLQAALSILLVAGAGLFAGSLWRLATLNPGFNPADITIVSVDTGKRPEKGPALASLYDRLLERAQAIPGVKAASMVWFPPLSDSGWDEQLSIPGRTDLSEHQRDTDMNFVGMRFFDVMQIPLIQGRDFTLHDDSASEKVGVLNEVAARRFFPRRSALGVQLEVEGKPIRIVGVVGSAKYMNLQEPDPPTLYFPYMQSGDQM
ncbi:MAG: FtsX-like permease family protein, partial [Bryobacteraceae bacterium]